jgi:hypothetical protein
LGTLATASGLSFVVSALVTAIGVVSSLFPYFSEGQFTFNSKKLLNN